MEDSASAFGNSWKTRASCFDVEDSFEDPCSNSVDKGSRLLIPGLSVLNNFHMTNNKKSFRNLITSKATDVEAITRDNTLGFADL